MSKLQKQALFAGLLALCVAGSSQAQTIQNGSFETSQATPGGPLDYSTVFAGSNGIANWTVGGGGVEIVATYWNALDGGKSVDLNWNPAAPGSISQTLTGLVAGQSYTVNFGLSGNPDGDRGAKTVQVAVDGAQAQNFVYDTLAQNNTKADMKWVTQGYTFTATGNSANLSFTSLGPNTFWGPVVDLARFGGGAGPQPVPEPSTMILVAGVAGLGWGISRMRRPTLAPVKVG